MLQYRHHYFKLICSNSQAAMLFWVLTLLNFRFSAAEIHSIHRHCSASKGIVFPKHIQFLMIDDIFVYYYDSSTKTEAKIPDWFVHPEQIELWREINLDLKFNRHIMENAVRGISEQFNHSDDYLYQAHGHCERQSDDSVMASMSHAFDGKDFVSFDVQTNTWIAAVPQAVFYKQKRQSDLMDLNRVSYHYRYGCLNWLNKLLQFSAEVRQKKVPKVRLIEHQGHMTSKVKVTCHVTGFYPREVKVQWLDAGGLPLVDQESTEEVLPNGDGTYQLRKSLTVSEGTHDSYSCLVLHSSVPGNITVSWAPKQNRALIFIMVGVIGAATLLILLWCGRIRILDFCKCSFFAVAQNEEELHDRGDTGENSSPLPGD